MLYKLAMKDEKDPQPTAEAPEPLDVMRKAFRSMQVPFQEGDGRLFTRLGLNNVEVQVFAWGFPDDLAKVIVRLPIRAARKHRAAAGDFLHRLNCNVRRKYWEMDCDSGEIRLSCFTDTIVGPLKEPHFWALLNSLVHAADTTFPFLTGVLNGKMTPDIAADQAQAAVQFEWAKENGNEEKICQSRFRRKLQEEKVAEQVEALHRPWEVQNRVCQPGG